MEKFDYDVLEILNEQEEEGLAVGSYEYRGNSRSRTLANYIVTNVAKPLVSTNSPKPLNLRLSYLILSMIFLAYSLCLIEGI